ncbi:MAG: hypothetical protein GY810_18855, partial [Aureispira sp.]|nr:hypothetical protein [Aureispira sp.]
MGKFIGIFISFIFAAIFGGLGIGFYVSTNNVLNNGVQTEGIVIENRAGTVYPISRTNLSR